MRCPRFLDPDYLDICCSGGLKDFGAVVYVPGG